MGNNGTFQGQGVQFMAGHSLEVWFQYGKGSMLPTPPLQTTHQTITALNGYTPLPGFNVTEACTVYIYQVIWDLKDMKAI